MNSTTQAYNDLQSPEHREVCSLLAKTINYRLPTAENEIWHAHPVGFLEGNPIVGYSRLKAGIRLLFWSGLSFDEAGLEKVGDFKTAGITYTTLPEINAKDLARWLKKSEKIQWDYKNIVKRKGQLDRLK